MATFADSADEEVMELENIWVASSDADLGRIKQLLEQGVSVNAQDDTGYSPM